MQFGFQRSAVGTGVSHHIIQTDLHNNMFCFVIFDNIFHMPEIVIACRAADKQIVKLGVRYIFFNPFGTDGGDSRTADKI